MSKQKTKGGARKRDDDLRLPSEARLLSPPCIPGRFENIEEVLRWAFADARHTFHMRHSHIVCHLLGREPNELESYELVTVIALGSYEMPELAIRAARAVAFGMVPVAAIWFVPGPWLEDGMYASLEREGAREREWRAVPIVSDLVELGAFEEFSGEPLDEDLRLCALPFNVTAQSGQYPHGPHAASRDELSAARRSLLRVRGRSR